MKTLSKLRAIAPKNQKKITKSGYMVVFENLICDDIMEDAYEKPSNPKF